MKVLILAAGKGTRLRPVTDYIPKPMVPLHGKPLLEWIILHLQSYGIRDYVIAVSYMAEQIENYFGDGSKWNIKIAYSYGKTPGGKAGEIWRARNLLAGQENFIVAPGDTICHLQYHDLLAFHKKNAGVATVALSTQYRLEVGLAQIDASHRITNFLEKTNLDRPVSTGTYVLHHSILSYIEEFNPDSNEVDLPGDIFPVLLSEGLPIYGFIADYAWWDIGKINDYEALVRMPAEQAAHILQGNIIRPNHVVPAGLALQ